MISTRTRLAFGLVSLLVSVMMLAMLMGIIPDRYRAVLDGRKALCEAIAVNGSVMVTQKDIVRLQNVLRVTAERNPDIVSAAVRRADGKVLVDVGDHHAHWTLAPGDKSNDNEIQVPIRAGEEKWGAIELCLRPVEADSFLGSWFGSRVRMVVFVGAACFLAFLYYLKKMLEYLDPSQSVPGHVRSALDTLAEGLLVLDGRDRIVLVNQAFASLLGKLPDKVVGQFAAKLPWAADPGSDSTTVFPWTMAMQEKRLVKDVVLRLESATGEVRTFMVNCSPVLGHNGQYRGVLAGFDDVTQLEQKEIELRKSKQIAEDASRTKSQFLANMSHEIRTPMNAILGFTDLLRRGMDGAEEDRAKYLDTIYTSGEHLLHLINDILDLSKIEAGRLEVEQIPTHPHNIFREVVTTLGIKAQERGLSLDLAIEGRLPETIQSDPLRLRQIVTNLVGNALKFTKQGGVTVRAQVVNLENQAHIKVDVVDTGVGIPEESLEKIFQPFMQADNSVTRNFGGTGLGLTISRRFAEALGGSLTASSRPGQGSTFTLTIPAGSLESLRLLSGDELAAESVRPASAKQSLRRPRAGKVLLVDDGEANRQLIRLVLTRAGVSVTEAENGQEAVDHATTSPFDLILMDMQMPVMDGYSAARRLRDWGLEIPIIALTGNAMTGDEEKCRAAGCSGFLSKPVSLDKLMDVMVAELGEAEDEVEEVQAPKPVVPPPVEILAQIPCFDEAIDVSPQAESASVPPESQLAEQTVRPPLVSTLWSDDPEFQEIVAGFVAKLRSEIVNLESACRERNWKALADKAHWLKGSVGTLGFAPITAPAKQLEQCAKARQAEAAERCLKEVIELIGSIVLPGYSAAIS